MTLGFVHAIAGEVEGGCLRKTKEDRKIMKQLSLERRVFHKENKGKLPVSEFCVSHMYNV